MTTAAAHAAMLGTWLGPGQTPKPDPQAAATLFVQAAELLAYEVGTPEAIEEARGAIGKAPDEEGPGGLQQATGGDVDQRRPGIAGRQEEALGDHHRQRNR